MPRSDILILATGPDESPRRMARSLQAVLAACNPYLKIDLFLTRPSRQPPLSLADLAQKLVCCRETLWASRSLYHFLHEERPRTLVCTSPAAAAWVSHGREKGKIPIPAAAVVTGETNLWRHTNLDLYLVAAEPLRDNLLREGVPEDKVAVTNLPVHPRFSLTHLPPLLRRRYNLQEDSPVILVTGELVKDKGAIAALSRFSPDFQIVLYPGTTGTPIPRFSRSLGRNSFNQFHFLSGQEPIEELISLAGVLVTSPDELTAIEAISKGLPFVIYRSGPADPYSRYLEETSLALTASEPGELAGKIRTILKNKGEGERLRRAQRRAVGRAATLADGRQEIASLILGLLEPPPMPLRSPAPKGSPGP